MHHCESSPRLEAFSPRCITVNRHQDWNEPIFPQFIDTSILLGNLSAINVSFVGIKYKSTVLSRIILQRSFCFRV
ncbi:hypothetical protein TNCV_3508581 [Trichonephila clavipes]|nr:hypothetical protein TNCV_3508581 [Trichonephila clavipes]